jgi:hypothetical protein
MLLNLIVGDVLCATNEYHTSGEAAFPQNALIPAVAVAATPAVLLSPPGIVLHVGADVSNVALLHASFAG